MPNQPVTFDAPLKQATSVTVPEGVTFEAPLSQNTTVPVSSTPAAQNTSANNPSAKTTPAQPSATISATPGSMPGDPMAAKLKLWTQNVQSDLMHGTNLTGIGAVLKAMGSHGLQYGSSEGVAKFMGSMPLGLMRATQGASEIAQPGQRWQGSKDTIGGLLDASTIPGGFMAPEAGEVAGKGGEIVGMAADAALSQAGKAAKGARDLVSVKSVQPKVQNAIATAIRQTAQEHGVSIPEGASVRDVAQTLSDAVRAKAHGLYQQLDAALGGTRFQTFDEQLTNIRNAIRDSLGIDPEKDAALAKRLQDVTNARNAVMDAVRKTGADPENLIGQADTLHQRAMALQDVSKAVRASTDVHPSAANEANVKLAPMFKRMQQLATPNPRFPGTPSRLIQALGEQRAADLLHAVDSAHLAAQKIAARNAWIKRGATAVGLYGLGREAFNGAHDLLSGGQ
jgi:hypothetical protein